MTDRGTDGGTGKKIFLPTLKAIEKNMCISGYMNF